MGIPWAIFATGIAIAIVALITYFSASDAIASAREKPTYWYRIVRNIAAVLAPIGFLLFIASFWVGAIGYGWFS
jgi:archaellum biogenesis protein FlaJ (TadC family)